MSISETLQALAEGIPETVGTYVLRKSLLELVAEVENLELERDDAIEELLQQKEKSID